MTRILALLALATAGCTASLDFSIDNLPCDSKSQCRAGYFCQNGSCVVGAPNLPCPSCPGGFACDATTGTCSRKVCDAFRQCGQGRRCDSGECLAVPARQPGDPCLQASDCENGVCLLPRGAPTARGYCALRCDDASACAPYSYASCVSLMRAGDGTPLKFCLPSDLSPGCSRDSDCRSWGLSCQIFSAPADRNQTAGVLLCANPVGANGNGAACVADADCVSAICIPGKHGSTCSAPCSDPSSDCAPGAICVRHRVQPDATPQVCLPPPLSLCKTCTTDATCGTDAPNCVTFSGGAPFCTARCAADADCLGLADGWTCQATDVTAANRACAPPPGKTCPM